VSDRFRVPAHNFRVCDDYRVLSPYAPYQLRRSVETVLALAKRDEGPLVVLDDGAYVVEALASIRRERWPQSIAIVEQTTRGIIKMNSSAALRKVVRQLPLVDVARSAPKRTLEPPFIAMSVCASLDRSIRSRYRGYRLRRCLVLGYGAIGEQVATFIDRHFGLGRGNVYVFDSDPERAAKAARRGFPAWNRQQFETGFDLVVGCSGRASFGVGDYVYLEDPALLASASSGAVELSRQDFIELADASPSDDIRVVRESLDERKLHSDLTFRLVDRTASVLNAGFPVNFDERITATPGRFIQPTPVMMLAASVQARGAIADGATGVIDLRPELCDWLDREFRDVLGEEAHLLVPPPEEAW
jgi:S-adenosylhomocysteine hydrolase